MDGFAIRPYKDGERQRIVAEALLEEDKLVVAVVAKVAIEPDPFGRVKERLGG